MSFYLFFLYSDYEIVYHRTQTSIKIIRSTDDSHLFERHPTDTIRTPTSTEIIRSTDDSHLFECHPTDTILTQCRRRSSYQISVALETFPTASRAFILRTAPMKIFVGRSVQRRTELLRTGRETDACTRNCYLVTDITEMNEWVSGLCPRTTSAQTTFLLIDTSTVLALGNQGR
jgi:hypothetical protein